jgi:uncharacterized protein
LKLTATIKPNSKKNEVTWTGENTITIRVTVPPIEGKANEKVIELLSDFFRKPKRLISIVAGFKSKTKIIEID